jgi:hypothetical protein
VTIRLGGRAPRPQGVWGAARCAAWEAARGEARCGAPAAAGGWRLGPPVDRASLEGRARPPALWPLKRGSGGPARGAAATDGRAVLCVGAPTARRARLGGAAWGGRGQWLAGGWARRCADAPAFGAPRWGCSVRWQAGAVGHRISRPGGAQLAQPGAGIGDSRFAPGQGGSRKRGLGGAAAGLHGQEGGGGQTCVAPDGGRWPGARGWGRGGGRRLFGQSERRRGGAGQHGPSSFTGGGGATKARWVGCGRGWRGEVASGC